MEKKSEVYYTVKEVARKLKLSEKTIRNKISQGEMQKTPVADRSIRIKESQLQAYLSHQQKKIAGKE